MLSDNMYQFLSILENFTHWITLELYIFLLNIIIWKN
jgi:hypothetical protein